jgi:hypothetical protein
MSAWAGGTSEAVDCSTCAPFCASGRRTTVHACHPYGAAVQSRKHNVAPTANSLHVPINDAATCLVHHQHLLVRALIRSIGELTIPGMCRRCQPQPCSCSPVKPGPALLFACSHTQLCVESASSGPACHALTYTTGRTATMPLAFAHAHSRHQEAPSTGMELSALSSDHQPSSEFHTIEMAPSPNP